MANVFSPKRTSKTSREFRPWYGSNINEETSYNLRDSQATSKQLATETPVGKAIIDRVTEFTLGQGLFPQSAPETAVLKCTDKEYARFTSEAESFFRYITDTKDFDYYRRNTFAQLQRIAMRNILISGDVLVHKVFLSKWNNYRPTIQLISGSAVYNNGNDTDSKTCIGGVELDSHGRESGYWIAQTDDNLHDTYTSKLFQKYNSAGKEEFFLVALNTIEANQSRGIPYLAAVRDAILDLSTYNSAAVQKALVQSLFTAFITHEKEEVPSSIHPTLANLAQQNATMKQEEPREEAGFSLASGNIVDLAPGEKLQMAESQTSATAFKDYVTIQLDLIGAAVGVPREALLASFQSSYSASKGSLSVAEKGFAVFRKDIADNLCQPIWEMVVDYGIRLGAITAPGYLEGNDRVKKAWLATTWIGPGAISLNPVQEVNAYVSAINAGLCTHEMAVRSLYGKDFDEVADRLEKETSTLNAISPKESKEEEEKENDSNE